MSIKGLQQTAGHDGSPGFIASAAPAAAELGVRRQAHLDNK